MRWFKHDTSARNDAKIKLLKRKFGSDGYAAYFQLLEIVGENIKENNHDEWGFVESIHTVDTLADECGIEHKLFAEILIYCNEIGLFHKICGKLCIPKILDRLDEYASRRKGNFDISQRKKEISGQCPDSVPTESGLNRGLEQKRIEENRKEKNIYTSPNSLTDEICVEIAKQYSVSEKAVRDIRDDLVGYCQSEGKRYKDYRATLQNWTRRALRERKLTKIISSKPPELPEVSEEEREKNRQILAQITQKLSGRYEV